jgi:hypothetical protein
MAVHPAQSCTLDFSIMKDKVIVQGTHVSKFQSDLAKMSKISGLDFANSS